LEKMRTLHGHLRDRLLYLNPAALIQKRHAELDRRCKELVLHHHRILDRYRMRFQNHVSRLEALSPLSVLQRGYSIAYRAKDRRILRSFKETSPGEKILVKLGKGSLQCTVEAAKAEKEDR